MTLHPLATSRRSPDPHPLPEQDPLREPHPLPERSPPAAPAAAPVTAIPLDAGRLLVLLPPGPPPPSEGAVAGGPDGLAWRAALWPAPAGGVAGVGLLRGANVAPARLAGGAVAPTGGGGPWPLPEIGRLELEPAALARHVLDTSGPPAAALTLLRAALPEGEAGGRARAFVQGYLAAAAQPDGFVEIVGRPEGGGLLLQGWATGLPAGTSEIGVVAGDLSLQAFAVAAFARADLLPPAKGFVAFAADARPGRAEAVRAVVACAGDRLLQLEVVPERRVLLEGEAAVAHLAAMLPRLEAEPAVRRRLERVCRPRWQGHETLSRLDRPVRAALDLALAVDAPPAAAGEGAGLLLAGWLLDPERRVGRVLLKSTGNAYRPLETGWVRLPRPDLLEAFGPDPLFAGRLRPHDLLHGFVAFLPLGRRIAEGERFYLELVLDDATCAFLPVEPETARPAHLPRLLAGLAPDEPELERLARDHLAPVAAALLAARPAPAPLGPPIPLGSPPAAPGLPPPPEIALVLPIGADWQAIEPLLAQLGNDPECRAAEIVLVAERETARGHGSRLRQAVAFYGLSGRLVLAAGPLDPFEALGLGARAATAGLLLGLTTAVLPRRPGWLGRLADALRRAPSAGLACPTLLYEDESIRFAGDPGAGDPAGPAGPEAAGRLAGYPAGWLAETAPVAVAHGPAECFLIRRELLLAAGGPGSDLIGPELRHLELAARLRAAGRTILWVPDVSLWALDEPAPAAPEPWRQVARLVDRAVLARRRDAADGTRPRAASAAVGGRGRPTMPAGEAP